VVSPGDWLVSSVLFFYLPVKLKLWGELGLSDHAGWSELLISPVDSCVTIQLQWLSQFLHQWGGAVPVWMLPSGSEDHLCSPLVVQVWKWLFSVLVYWDFCTGGLFLCPGPFLWGRLSVCQPSLLSVCYNSSLFVFQFCGQFDLGCCSLAQEMSSMIHYLPCFGKWLIAHSTLGFCAFPVFFYWFFALILSPSFSSFLRCTFSIPVPSAVVLDYILIFVIQVFLGGSQSARGLFWLILGVAGGIPCDTWHSPVCSVKCLTGRIRAGGGSCCGGSGGSLTLLAVQRVTTVRCN
jgi:hypothetical protein